MFVVWAQEILEEELWTGQIRAFLVPESKFKMSYL